MSKVLIAAIAGVVVGFGAGYAVFAVKPDGGANGSPVAAQPAPVIAAASGKADLKQLSEPLMQNLVEALKKKDYKLFIRDFQPEMVSTVPETQFKQFIALFSDAAGAISQPEWVGGFRKTTSSFTIWKIKSPQTGEDMMVSLQMLVVDGYPVKVLGVTPQ